MENLFFLKLEPLIRTPGVKFKNLTWNIVLGAFF